MEHKNLEELIDLAEILSEQNNFQEILRLVAQKAISIFHAETALILLLNPKTQQTVKTIYKGGREILKDRYRLVSANVYGWVLDNRYPFLSRDIKKDTRFHKNQFKDIQVKSVMATLLKVEGFIIGCLLLINHADEKEFKEEDLEILKKMSGIVSPYLRNIQKLKEYFEASPPEEDLLSKYKEMGMLGKCRKFIELIQSIEAAARCDVRVLLEGKSGTGKEMIARAIHQFSARKIHPFHAIDCGAIPEHLIESELFGYVKGAFTGATRDRIGLIESADQGSLFIDEVANLSYEMQAKLLRVLQEGEVRAVGSNKPRKLNVRIIAASSSSLRKLVEQGQFREDLYYRLYVYPIHLPTLHERREDISLLANHFLNKFVPQQQKQAQAFHGSLLNFMKHRKWPGNIRELENFVERLVALVSTATTIIGDEILPIDLKDEYHQFAVEQEAIMSSNSLKERLQGCEQQIIRQALIANNWNQSQAARSLKISEQMIRYRMKKTGVTREKK